MRTFTLLCLFLGLFAYAAKAQDPVKVNLEIIATPLTSGDLPMTAGGQQIWGDYNHDGLLDIFMITGQGSPFSALYKNNGNGTYTEVLTDVTMMALSSAVFFDYDNDGNLDLLIAGSADGTTSAALTELYHNSGAPDYNLELNEEASFVGISAEGGDNNTRLLEAVDYDNDGWTDVFMSGNAGGTWDVSGNSRVVALYRNNQGTFELQTTPVEGTGNFISMNGGGIHCGDVNNDGYTDMIVSGYVDDDVKTATDLYLNKGDGTFSYFENSRTLFTGQMQGETFFADINNDGWPDIIEVGRDVNNGWANFANLYMNKQDGTFIKVETGTNLLGGSASAAAGDLNNDGLTDIALSGWGPNLTFFYNRGDSSFLAAPIDPDKARARAGCINMVDFNKDGNLDFTVFGYRDGGDGTADNPTWPDYLLVNNLNDGIDANEPPSAPENIEANQDGENVVISWDQATDDKTPAGAIRYNVFAKAIEGNHIFTYFPADVDNGFLTANLNGMRPLINGTTLTLTGMSKDDFIFGVQAVDNENSSSDFTTTEVTTSVKNNPNLDKVLVLTRGNKIMIRNHSQSSVSFRIVTITGTQIMSGTCDSNYSKELSVSASGVLMVQFSDGTSGKVEKVVLY